jgi:hypothetical protein
VESCVNGLLIAEKVASMSDPLLDLSGLKATFKDRAALREGYAFLAQTSEKAEKFDHMLQVACALIKNNGSEAPTAEERRIISVAFKNAVGQLRAAKRSLASDPKFPELAQHYKRSLDAELADMCNQHLTLFDTTLSKACQHDALNKVFYLKLTADIFRYLAEQGSPDAASYGEKASERYNEALDVAEAELEPTHPVRLGVALNYAVCWHEVLGDTRQACQMAQSAFNQAIAKLDEHEQEFYKDSTLLMQLLRDNLTYWALEEAK